MYCKEIELDKPRMFRYDFNAVADIEEKADMNIAELLKPERFGHHTIRLIVWGGLRWNNKGLTIDAAGKMINKFMENGGDVEEVYMQIQDMLVKAGILKIVEDTEGNLEAETD